MYSDSRQKEGKLNLIVVQQPKPKTQKQKTQQYSISGGQI